jgi:hypothetical protein
VVSAPEVPQDWDLGGDNHKDLHEGLVGIPDTHTWGDDRDTLGADTPEACAVEACRIHILVEVGTPQLLLVPAVVDTVVDSILPGHEEVADTLEGLRVVDAALPEVVVHHGKQVNAEDEPAVVIHDYDVLLRHLRQTCFHCFRFLRFAPRLCPVCVTNQHSSHSLLVTKSTSDGHCTSFP